MLESHFAPIGILGMNLSHVVVGGGDGGITPASPNPSTKCLGEHGESIVDELDIGRRARLSRCESMLTDLLGDRDLSMEAVRP